jgi:hypothetical protein
MAEGGRYIDRNICVGPVAGVGSPYGYLPSFAAGIAFCVIFGLSMFHHTYVSIRYKTWWQFIFVVGALGKFFAGFAPNF